MLDVDQYARIKQAGLEIEVAVTYAALMKSTDETNTISRGGINSVVEYTGLTRSKAKRSVNNLVRAGLIEVLDVDRIRARTVPRYRLPYFEGRTALASLEEGIVSKVDRGGQPEGQSEIAAAQRATKKAGLKGDLPDGKSSHLRAALPISLTTSLTCVGKRHRSADSFEMVNSGHCN